MSRSKSRADDRMVRFKDGLREAFKHARKADAKAVKSLAKIGGEQRYPRDDGELGQLLREIERSGICVWAVAKAIRCSDEERAMIEQIVAPRLAGMTPGSVHRKHYLGDQNG